MTSREVPAGSVTVLLIRGSFAPDDLRLLMDSLDPRGLFLNVMVRDRKEVEVLRPLVGM